MADDVGRFTIRDPFQSAVESFSQIFRESFKDISDFIVASAIAYFCNLIVDPEKPAKLVKLFDL